ncbi:MAG: glycosyltransferase [Methanosarcina sp.]|nr:glycosyltransferase [Methanosarcina sp.]
MKILILKPYMTQARYHFERTQELSRFMSVTWLIGSHPREDKTSYDEYISGSHKIETIERKFRYFIVHKFFFEICYVLKAMIYLKNAEFDLAIVHYHRLAFMLALFSRKKSKLALQLFTSSVAKSPWTRRFQDLQFKFNAQHFARVLVGTDYMIRHLKLDSAKCSLIQWGMNPISRSPQVFAGKLSLVYLGTLNGRQIPDTIRGLGIFIRKFPQLRAVTYSIIGKGAAAEVQKLVSTIHAENLQDIVQYLGYIDDNDLKDYIDSCNVGVSYVPVTKYYNDVIATKTYEYLLSGLCVLATNTNENRKMVNQNNGVLIEDNPASFANGLEQIWQNMENYSSQKIVKESIIYTLEYRVKNSVVPLLKKLAAAAAKQ